MIAPKNRRTQNADLLSQLDYWIRRLYVSAAPGELGHWVALRVRPDHRLNLNLSIQPFLSRFATRQPEDMDR